MKYVDTKPKYLKRGITRTDVINDRMARVYAFLFLVVMSGVGSLLYNFLESIR